MSAPFAASAPAVPATEPDALEPPTPIILPLSYFEAIEGTEADMETTRLSTKGQVIIPKDIRQAKNWAAGQELEVRLTKEGVLLKPRSPFPETRMEDVAGCLWRPGVKAKTDAEISRLSTKAIREAWNDDSR